MQIEQYLTDDQDPKTAEKILSKLRDMLTSGEAIIYLAIQKKPAVTIIAECIAVTNKRIIFCIPENLGLTTNFVTYGWNDIKEVSFKEEFFGSKFLAIPQRGENVAVDYIPKVQARKLYQFCNEQLEKNREKGQGNDQENRINPPIADTTSYSDITEEAQPYLQPTETPAYNEPEDEVTLKLRKLKLLFEKQLITVEEYETKKADILSQL